ncbi:MAG: response regulator transcription factor [Bacteroidetes bacterium]|nr:response regulator transcription factor [Bacteroidota bacterium]
MINVVIIDDEPKNIRILKRMLAEFCPEVNVVAEGKDVQEAEDVLKQYKPSLVFLDIEMPYGNAFDLLNKLMPVSFEIIFITAFNEYALKAFKYSAVDYLLKPVSIHELKMAVEKATERINSRHANYELQNLLQNMERKDESKKKIAMPSKEGLIFIATENIIRCEASGGYTHVFTSEHGKIITSKNIKEYEMILPENIFYRIHYSHIVNLKQIKKYHRGRGGYVEMKDGILIDVAVRRKDEFLSRFNILK